MADFTTQFRQDPSSLDGSVYFSFELENDDTRDIAGLTKISSTPFGDWQLGCVMTPWNVAAGQESKTLTLEGDSDHNANGPPSSYDMSVPCGPDPAGGNDQVSNWVQGTITSGQKFEMVLTGTFVDGTTFTASASGTY